MKNLTSEELIKVNGGGFKIAFLMGIAAGVSFIMGVIDGVVRPLKCR